MYPTYEEIKAYIKKKNKVSICDIRDEFNQTGNSVMSMNKKDIKLVVAYGIDADFYRYLQGLFKEPDVNVEINGKLCLLNDRTIYDGDGDFIGLVLSMK